MNSDFFLARQPIVDRERELVAYELLFRNGEARTTADVTNDEQATATVILNAFTEMGLVEALGSHLGFINVSAEMLLSDMIWLLPKEQIVIELLETIKITPEVIERCRQLADEGYTLALDDCIEMGPDQISLLPYIRIIKVDLMLLDQQQLIDLTIKLDKFNIRKLAEKVDSAEQYELCMSLGYDLFQGYFFAKPSLMKGKKAASESDPMILRILSLISSDAETEEIEESFKHAPTLTVALLRLVNSVAAGVPRHVASVRDALMVLGRQKLKRWVQLMVFAVGNVNPYGSANALLEIAATRGRMMELLAARRFPKNRTLPDQAFMTGMLSMVDALLDKPLNEILATAGISAEITQALLEGTGDLGDLMTEVIEAEVGLGEPELAEIQIQAMRWVQSTRQTSSTD